MRTAGADGPRGGVLRTGGLALLLLVAAGAALRLATLGTQSLSDDELFTTWLVQMPFRDMIDTIPRSEATPPLFYVLEWMFTQVTGTGEVGMRILPALTGTLTIPVVYMAAAVVASRRAGLAAAALAAFNPFLIWYSQDARAYPLLILLVAVSLLFLLLHDRDRGTGALVGWGVASAAALATHYFAFFAIAPQAAWLLLTAGPDLRRRALAVAIPGVVGLALAPLALLQRSEVSDPGGVRGSALFERLVAIPKNFLVGFSVPAEAVVSALTGALALAGVVLALRAAGPERRGARLGLIFASGAVALPLVVAPFGFDYVTSRNVVAALVPLALGLGCGFASARAGAFILAALCAISAGTAIGVAASPEYGRRDWRGAAQALGPATTDRVLVFTPRFSNPGPFGVYYGSGSRLLRREDGPVREVVVVALAKTGDFGPGAPRPPSGPSPRPPRGFRTVEDKRTPTYRLIRFRAQAPRRLSGRDLVGAAFRDVPGVLVWQPGDRP